jgi:hypothetical protein
MEGRGGWRSALVARPSPQRQRKLIGRRRRRHQRFDGRGEGMVSRADYDP